MTDIVSILRTWPAGERVNVNVMREAADEIARLRAALDTCRELREYDRAALDIQQRGDT